MKDWIDDIYNGDFDYDIKSTQKIKLRVKYLEDKPKYSPKLSIRSIERYIKENAFVYIPRRINQLIDMIFPLTTKNSIKSNTKSKILVTYIYNLQFSFIEKNRLRMVSIHSDALDSLHAHKELHELIKYNIILCDDIFLSAEIAKATYQGEPKNKCYLINCFPTLDRDDLYQGNTNDLNHYKYHYSIGAKLNNLNDRYIEEFTDKNTGRRDIGKQTDKKLYFALSVFQWTLRNVKPSDYRVDDTKIMLTTLYMRPPIARLKHKLYPQLDKRLTIEELQQIEAKSELEDSFNGLFNNVIMKERDLEELVSKYTRNKLKGIDSYRKLRRVANNKKLLLDTFFPCYNDPKAKKSTYKRQQKRYNKVCYFLKSILKFKQFLKYPETRVGTDGKGRIYSTFTNLNKEIRKYIYFRDNRVCLDIVNSQVALLADFLNYDNCEKELLDSMKDGTFYSVIAKKRNYTEKQLKAIKKDGSKARSIVKKWFFPYLMKRVDKEVENADLAIEELNGMKSSEFFAENYRMFHKTVLQLKSEGSLARMLQELEADLMIWGNDRGKYNALTIHDCIYLKDEHVEEFKEYALSKYSWLKFHVTYCDKYELGKTRYQIQQTTERRKLSSPYYQEKHKALREGTNMVTCSFDHEAGKMRYYSTDPLINIKKEII